MNPNTFSNVKGLKLDLGPTPGSIQFDEETKQRIQAAQAAGVPEEQIQQEAIAYQMQKSQTSQTAPQEKKGFRASDLLPIAGGIIGGVGGSFIAPGAGTLIGGGAGSAAGEALRQMLEGEKADIGKIGIEGALGAIPVGKVLGGASKIAGKAVTKVIPERLMGSVFKETVGASKTALAKGESLGGAALAKGTKGTTDQIYQSAIKQISAAENELQQVLIRSKGGVKIVDIKQTVKPLITKLKDIGDTAGAKEILSRIAKLEARHGAVVPASAANKIKRGLYEEADKAYIIDKAVTPKMEGVKAIARGFKEGLEELTDIPKGKISQLNKNLAHYGREKRSMLDKMTRDERNNLIGLTDLPLAGVGLLPGGQIPAAGVYAAKKAFGSTFGKTNLAQGLSKAGEVVSKTPPIVGNIAAQSAGQALSRLPGALIEPHHDDNDINYEYNPDPQFHDATISQDINNINSAQQAVDQAVTQSSYVTGYSPEELYSAYSQAISAGDKASATQLRQMYTDETAYQKTQGGRKSLQLSDTAIKIVTDLQGASVDIQGLRSSILASNAVGPLSGFRAINPYDIDAVSLQSEIDRVRQVVGKALEGGVLRKEDEEKYKKILPTMTDSKQVALNKLDQLENKINEDLTRYSGTQQQFGKGRSSENISIEQQAAQQAIGF